MFLNIRRQDSWTALAGRLFPTTSGEESNQADLESVVSRDANMINTLVEIGVSPIDEHNTQLLDNVHPANWKDAEPDGVSLECVLRRRRLGHGGEPNKTHARSRFL